MLRNYDRKEALFEMIDEYTEKDDPKSSWAPIDSYVQQLYFIQAGDRGPIKIGVSKSPASRVKELQTGNPTKLRLIWYCTPKSNRVEFDLHEIFRDQRLEGEWFKPNELMAEVICNAIQYGFDGCEYRTTPWIFDLNASR